VTAMGYAGAMNILAAFVFSVVALAGAANHSYERQKPASATIGQVGWLAGSWIGGDGANPNEEHWMEPAGGAMLATARTVKGSRMVAFEFLRIVERDGGLVYLAMPGGRSPATEFVATAVEKTGITFENPSHDFPKVIRYALTGDGALEATISDGRRKSITFRFTRKQ
jgi:Domain of unknown function (DUF6265)